MLKVGMEHSFFFFAHQCANSHTSKSCRFSHTSVRIRWAPFSHTSVRIRWALAKVEEYSQYHKKNRRLTKNACEELTKSLQLTGGVYKLQYVIPLIINSKFKCVSGLRPLFCQEEWTVGISLHVNHWMRRGF